MKSAVRRVMFAGDWHGEAGWADLAISIARHEVVDAIVQLGDFGIWPGQRGRAFLDGVNLALVEANLPLYFVDGNHEDFPQLYGYPMAEDGTRTVRTNIHHLPRGFRWTWMNTTFLALGGATSLDRPGRREGVSWWPEEEITADEALAVREGGHADIMLTHDCPSGVDIPGINPVSDLQWPPQEIQRANVHRALLGTVVDEVNPELLMHGHFHIPYRAVRGSGTKVIGLDMAGSNDNIFIGDLNDWGQW